MRLAVKSAAPELVMAAEFAAPRAVVVSAWTDKTVVTVTLVALLRSLLDGPFPALRR